MVCFVLNRQHSCSCKEYPLKEVEMFMKVTFGLGFKILLSMWPILPPAPVITPEPLILVQYLLN